MSEPTYPFQPTDGTSGQPSPTSWGPSGSTAATPSWQQGTSPQPQQAQQPWQGAPATPQQPWQATGSQQPQQSWQASQQQAAWQGAPAGAWGPGQQGLGVPVPAGAPGQPQWQNELLPDHPQANGVQTFGLIAMVLSFVGFGILAPFALARALKVRKEIAQRPGLYRTGGPVQAGLVMSIVGTVVFALLTLMIVLLVVALGASD